MIASFIENCTSGLHEISIKLSSLASPIVEKRFVLISFNLEKHYSAVADVGGKVNKYIFIYLFIYIYMVEKRYL